MSLHNFSKNSAYMKKMLNHIRSKGNANSNHNEIVLYTRQSPGQNVEVLVRM